MEPPKTDGESNFKHM